MLKATNKYGETAIIEEIPNPLYNMSYVAMIEPTTTQVRFEGLTGRSAKYIKNAGIHSFRSLLSTAQEMIKNGTKFEDALTNILKEEFAQYRKKYGNQ